MEVDPETMSMSFESVSTENSGENSDGEVQNRNYVPCGVGVTVQVDPCFERIHSLTPPLQSHTGPYQHTLPLESAEVVPNQGHRHEPVLPLQIILFLTLFRFLNLLCPSKAMGRPSPLLHRMALL